MNRTPTAIAVGETRDDANRIFGRLFSDVQLETYADLTLTGADAPQALGLTGGVEEMLRALDAVIAQRPAGLGELHLHLRDDAARAAVASWLSAASQWVLTDLAHAPDGTPVLVASRAEAADGGAVPFAIGALPIRPAATASWPSAGAADTARARDTTAPSAPATPAVSGASAAGSRLPMLRGRTRKLALLAAAAAAVGVVVLVVLAVIWGFEGLVVGLLLAVAAVQVAGLAALAYAVRAVVRTRHDVDALRHDLERLRGQTDRRTTRLLNRLRNLTQLQRRGLGVSRKTRERVADLHGAQKSTSEYLAELAGAETRRANTALERNRLAHLATQRQVQALLRLEHLVQPSHVPPMGGWAASPDLLVLCLELFLERKPRCVVETGSGVSTLFLAAAAERYDIDCRVVALEHDERFARATRELLERNGLAHRAEVVLAELVPTGLPGHSTPWYDAAALTDLHDVGMLLVDGPPEATGPDVRYPAVPLLADRLADSCVVVADDVIRPSDRNAVERWRGDALADFDFTLRTDLEKHAAVLRRG